MISKKRWIVIVILILASLLAYQISNIEFIYPPQPQRVTMEKEVIKIGAVLPLSGDDALLGENVKRGIELALEEINSNKLHDNIEIEVKYEDSKSDPAEAVSALNKLIELDGVPVVIGDISSSCTMAMAQDAERNKVVLLSPGASSPEISYAGAYIFRNYPSDATEAGTLAELAYNTLHLYEVGIYYVNDDFGIRHINNFSDALEGLGGQVLFREVLERGTADLSPQIERISNSQPDGIFIVGYPTEVGLLLKQILEKGIRIPRLSVHTFEDQRIIDIAGGAEYGTTFSASEPPELIEDSNFAYIDFGEAYKTKYGEQPGLFSNTGYDAVKIINWAVEKGARDGESIRNMLTTLKDFPGAAGKTTFNKYGDVIRGFGFKSAMYGEFNAIEIRAIEK